MMGGMNEEEVALALHRPGYRFGDGAAQDEAARGISEGQRGAHRDAPSTEQWGFRRAVQAYS
jgi:hypothetical protein